MTVVLCPPAAAAAAQSSRSTPPLALLAPLLVVLLLLFAHLLVGRQALLALLAQSPWSTLPPLVGTQTLLIGLRLKIVY